MTTPATIDDGSLPWHVTSMTALTLYIGNKNLSSWSLRPWLALTVGRIAFEERVVLLDRPDTKARISAVSPNGKVPALVAGDVTLWESLAICEYAAELAPSLWPADRDARALARCVSHEMHAGFAALRSACPMNLKLTAATPVERSAAVSADVERILALWRACRERFGAGGPFLFGAFSIADAMYAPVTTRFTSYGLPTDDVGAAYVAAVQALPAFQQWRTAALAES